MMELRLASITKKYQERVILDHVSFDFSKPGLYLLIGKSGSGKTTLMNILAGYDRFDEGEIIMSPSAITAYIFQSFELIQELTVKENIQLCVQIQHKKDYDQMYFERLIAVLGIEHIMSHYPNELSQGQKQRVGIARALLADADVYFCDEPTEALDEQVIDTVMQLLWELSKNKIIIMATHNQSIIKAGKANIIKIQDGKLVSIDKQEELEKMKFKDQKHVDRVYKPEFVCEVVDKIIQKKTRSQMLFLGVGMGIGILFFSCMD